ncbi:MAG: M28 family peptidase [Oscillospiraceae bacterium]
MRGCELCPAREGAEHLLLDAHIDEIGFVVTGVTDGGFRVAACGGVDRRLLPAQEVTVHGKKAGVRRDLPMPPHLESAESAAKVPKIEDIAIDIGYTKQQAEQLVSPGDTVSIRQTAAMLPGGQITAKALDDRAGVAALLACAQRLSEEKLSCGLTILCSTQEEVGARGAKAAAWRSPPRRASPWT